MDHDELTRLATSLSGTYAIERELGGGGMSRVFVAEETALGRRVVVKVLPPELAEALSAERFVREIRVAARLQQANIVPVLRAGELDGLPYYTMPFVAGESLRAAMTAGTLSTPQALAILRDVARALAYAHGEGVIHRDIKPENVLLSAGTAVVTDFGIAKAIAAARGSRPGRDGASDLADTALTRLGMSLGTPGYMAPEQAAGDPNTDARADLYAWGVMAYELLAGRHPFARHRVAHELIRAHMSETPEHLSARARGVPVAVSSLVMRCLAKAPNERPASAAELVEALDAAMHGAASRVPARPVLGLGRALLIYAAVLAVVAVAAKLSITLIGLPEWVFAGAVGVMVLGLPVVLLTALIERQRSVSAPTPTAALSRTVAQLARQHPHRFTWGRTTKGGLLAGAAFVIAIGGYMAMRSFGLGPFGSLIGSKALAARDHILIADMRGPASDTTLGAVFAEGMRVGLGESNAIRLVSTDLARLTLERMQRPGATMSADVAREVAARVQAKAVLDGDVQRVGSAAILTVRLLPVTGGDPLVTLQETARDDADFSAATGRLAKKLRARVGESLRRVNAMPPLEQVTTASLPALRKYTAAGQAESRGDYLNAFRLYREAIAIDSQFVGAYVQLGGLIQQISGMRQSQTEMLQRAFDLRHRLPKQEQMAAEVRYWFSGPDPDLHRAIALAEAAREQYPDAVWPLRHLSYLYPLVHEPERGIPVSRAALAADSSFFEAFYDLGRDFAEAGQLDSMRAMLGEFERAAPSHPLLPFMHVPIALLAGDDSTAWAIARASESMRSQPIAAEFGAYLHSALAERAGKLREALAANEVGSRGAFARGARMSVYSTANLAATYRVLYLGDSAGAIRQIDSAVAAMPMDSVPPRDRRPGWFGDLYVAARRPDRLRALVAAQERDDPKGFDEIFVGALPLLRAQLARAEGRHADAVRYYREAFASGPPTMTTGVLGNYFFEIGEKDSALVYLERFVHSTSIDFTVFTQSRLLAPSRQHLAELYEERGELGKAYELYAALVEQWRYADPELQPFVSRMQGRMRSLQKRTG